MPSLYLRGQLNLVLLQLPVRLLVICHEQQQSLARWPLKEVEVVLKVGGKLRAGVIGKIGVQGEYQTRECVFLLQLLDGPRLKQTFPDVDLYSVWTWPSDDFAGDKMRNGLLTLCNKPGLAGGSCRRCGEYA